MKQEQLRNLQKIKEFKDLISITKAQFTTKDFYHLEKNRNVFQDDLGTYIVYLDRDKKYYDFIFIKAYKGATRPPKRLK